MILYLSEFYLFIYLSIYLFTYLICLFILLIYQIFIRNIFIKNLSGYISENVLYIMIYKYNNFEFKFIARNKVRLEEKVEKRLKENMIKSVK